MDLDKSFGSRANSSPVRVWHRLVVLSPEPGCVKRSKLKMSSNWKALQKKLNILGKKTTTVKASRSKLKSAIEKVNNPIDSDLIDDPSIPGLSDFQRRPKRLDAVLLNEDDNLLKPTSLDTDVVYNKSKQKVGAFVALDCEFVGTGFKGKNSELARVSIVNYYGYPVLDLYVKPLNFVTDWRTKWSGITPDMMKEAVPFSVAQSKVAALIKDKILVGHGLKNDTKVMMLSHPRHLTVDTQVLQRYRECPVIKGRPGLKRLAKSYLGLDIQIGSHSSVQDAQASMLLFRLFKDEYMPQKPKHRAR